MQENQNQQQAKEVKNQVSLNELIPLYYEANAQAKKFKETATALSEQIKEICLKDGLKKVELDGFKANVVIQNRSSFDDEVLLECVKKLDESVKTKIIRVKEYVDPQELEKAVFVGAVKPEEIKPAEIVKEVVTLRVTKK